MPIPTYTIADLTVEDLPFMIGTLISIGITLLYAILLVKSTYKYLGIHMVYERGDEPTHPHYNKNALFQIILCCLFWMEIILIILKLLDYPNM